LKLLLIQKTKEFEISIGSPPISALIKKEVHVEKASGNALTEMVADMKIEQVIKIAQMKSDSMSPNPKSAVKTVVGTCVSMGIMVEGKNPREAMEDINSGMYDEKIASGKTELSEEELAVLEEERKKLAEEMATKYAEEEKVAQAIIDKLSGKSNDEIRSALKAEDISSITMNKLAPEEKAEEGGGAADSGGAEQ